MLDEIGWDWVLLSQILDGLTVFLNLETDFFCRSFKFTINLSVGTIILLLIKKFLGMIVIRDSNFYFVADKCFRLIVFTRKELIINQKI